MSNVPSTPSPLAVEAAKLLSILKWPIGVAAWLGISAGAALGIVTMIGPGPETGSVASWTAGIAGGSLAVFILAHID